MTVANGRGALPAITESGPRLSCLDIMLLELDGLALMGFFENALRARSSCCRHEARRPTAFTGIHGRADDYVVKPFSPAELVLMVKGDTEQRRSQIEGAYAELLRLSSKSFDPRPGYHYLCI